MKITNIKPNKGEYLYIKRQKRIVFIFTAFMYIAALAIYYLGIKTCHTYKNIWTVVSILSILPASKSMVNFIMFSRFKSLTETDANLYKETCQNMPFILELAFTTYSKTYFIDVLTCSNNTVIGYRNITTANGKRGETKSLEEHLKEVLAVDGFKDCTIKIFESKDAFLKRAGEMCRNLDVSADTNANLILNTLKSVTL